MSKATDQVLQVAELQIQCLAARVQLEPEVKALVELVRRQPAYREALKEVAAVAKPDSPIVALVKEQGRLFMTLKTPLGADLDISDEERAGLDQRYQDLKGALEVLPRGALSHVIPPLVVQSEGPPKPRGDGGRAEKPTRASGRD